MMLRSRPSRLARYSDSSALLVEQRAALEFAPQRDADRDRQPADLIERPIPDRAASTLDGRPGAVRMDLRQDPGELLAADARQQVAPAQHPCSRAGDLAQRTVADGMPMPVVDRLESIEVEDRHRQRAAMADRIGHLLVEPLVEQAAVRKPGERIVRRQPLELDLVVVALGDVADRADPADDLAVRVAHR